MYLTPYRSPANLGYLGRAARRSRGRLRGLGDYVAIMVTDPQLIAQFKQTAVKNGIDPATVDEMISKGADAVQIALAVTRAPSGPAQVISQLDITNQLTAEADAARAQAAGASALSPAPSPTQSMADFFKSNWYWLAGGVAVLFLARKAL